MDLLTVNELTVDELTLDELTERPLSSMKKLLLHLKSGSG